MSAGKERKKLIKRELIKQRDALKLAAEALFNDRKDLLEQKDEKVKQIEEMVKVVADMRTDYVGMMDEHVRLRTEIVALTKERDELTKECGELRGFVAATGIFPNLGAPMDAGELNAEYGPLQGE